MISVALLTVAVLVACARLSRGFNVDVKGPTVLRGNPGSYFGFSVSMMVDGDKKWVFVGSPRDNDTVKPAIDRPGAVYKCSFEGTPTPVCMQLHVDNSTGPGQEMAEFDGGKKFFIPGRDGNWLGGTVDFPQENPGKGIVTCAHRWYNLLNGEHYMNGMCYLFPIDLTMSNAQKVPAMIGGSLQTVTLPWGKVVDLYSYAALGLSAHWTKKEAKLLLGAPGLFGQTGGFVEIDGSKVRYIKSESSIWNYTTTDMYGWVITSGEYFGDGHVYYGLGAPRVNLTGKVVLFKSSNAEFQLSNTDVEIVNESLPINAYFGSILCTVDVNNDGLDDLLVGAPLYSPSVTDPGVNADEEGRVFLYLGMRSAGEQGAAFSANVQMFGGREIPGARFGSAIGNLGDINRDSFEDIVVGAPYEDEHRGAVYIYNGYTDGLYHVFSQRVAARQLDQGLRGFGIAVSRVATDINNDHTPDFVVGSYLSDNAVVLYGQPVVHLQRTLDVTKADGSPTVMIPRNSSGYLVDVCLKFIDDSCSFIVMKVTVHLDKTKGLPRMMFVGNRLPYFSIAMRLFSADITCKAMPIAVRSTSDLVSPILVEAEYKIETMGCQGLAVTPTINAFNGSNPGHPLLINQKTVYFEKDCPDNFCQTDLHLGYTVIYPGDKLYFTSGMPYLVININITKSGHPSYGSKFVITYPNYLKFRKMDQVRGDNLVSCQAAQGPPRTAGVTQGAARTEGTDKAATEPYREELIVDMGENEAGMVCGFGNPMYADSGVEFQVTIAVPSEVTVSGLQLQLAALTQSKETSPADNNQTAMVELKHEVDAGLNGRANPDSLFVGKTWTGDYPVRHMFELQNNGPSILPAARLSAQYPRYQKGGHAQLYLHTVEVNCSYPCEFNCTSRNAGKSPPFDVIQNGRVVINASLQNATDLMPYDAINTLDCTSGSCATYECDVTKLVVGKSVVMLLQFGLTNEIQRLTKDGNSLAFLSTAQVEMDSGVVMTTESELTEKLRTVLIPPKPKETVDWWIIVASIIGGIALIALIVLILYKVGFFKRKKWEEIRREEPAQPSQAEQPKQQEAGDFDKVSFTDSEADILENRKDPDEEVTF